MNECKLRGVGFISILFLILSMAMGCGNGEDEQELVCVAGTVQECPCLGGEQGIQTCMESGSFDTCQCPGTDDLDAGYPDDAGEDPDTADDPDTGGPDDLNDCGGESELNYEGSPASLDDVCGPCNDGILACQGTDELRCIQATEANECGGCQPLAHPVDASCGACGDGSYQCTEDGTVECVGASDSNACGGCAVLDDEPGDVCDVDGTAGLFECQSQENVVCVTEGNNACGGTSTLDAAPATACGSCGQGVWTCDGTDDVRCEDEDAGVNDCGGCAPLGNEVGGDCGSCGGQWVCDGGDGLSCEDATNACGGCSDLGASLGDSCGDGGAWVCDGAEDLKCDEEQTANACGGTQTLDTPPGESCGDCDDGETICVSPNATACVGASSLNDCGGCGGLAGTPGSTCATQSEWQCDDDDAVECVFLGDYNSCGGIEELDATPGSVCEECGVWVCDGEEDVQCMGGADTSTDPDNCGSCGNQCTADQYCAAGSCDAYNGCGGTSSLTGEPGSTCEECGVWACDGEEAVQCLGGTDTSTDPENCGTCGNQCTADQFCTSGSCQSYNSCGGTSSLDGEPDQTCGDCGVWTCQGEEAVSCEGEVNLQTDPDNCGICGNDCAIDEYCDAGSCEVFNGCGGTGDLAGEPNQPCGDCGVWVCTGSNSVSCQGEVELQTDPDNCGSCGNDCAINAYCEAGGCELYNSCGGTEDLPGEQGETCEECGEWVCDGENSINCEGGADTQNDFFNCGACGNVCKDGEYCEGGSCEVDQVVQVVGGNSFTCTLRESGEVSCWGSGNGVLAGNIDDATAIAAGGSHACALRESGEVLCWGNNTNDQLGTGGGHNATPLPVQDLENVTAITAGGSHTCAVEAGQAYCWGYNNRGQLGDGSTNNRSTPVAVSDELNAAVTDISGGSSHTCAVANSEAYCWGQGNGGQLGYGSSSNSSVPVKVSGLPSARSVTAGSSHSCAISNGNLAYCWGRNTDGQLGIGSFGGSSNTALSVVNLGVVQEVSTGLSNITCALRTDGRAYCWGHNRWGALGIGSEDNRNLPQWVSTLGDEVIDIKLGNNHSCAVLSNGQVACWGRNTSKVLGDNQLGSNGFERWLPVISPLIPPLTSEYGWCFTGSDFSGNGMADCDDPDCATDLGGATGDDVVNGQLLGFAGHYTQGTCGGTGPEHVYAWTAPSSGTFVFDTGGEDDTASDVVLYLRASCIADELGCATDGGTDDRPRLEVDVTEGQTYFLIVDSEPLSGSVLSGNGVYTVHINPAD